MTVKEFIGTLESSDRLRIIEGKAEVYVGYLAAFKPFADHEISEEYRKYSGNEVKKFRAVPEITHSISLVICRCRFTTPFTYKKGKGRKYDKEKAGFFYGI